MRRIRASLVIAITVAAVLTGGCGDEDDAALEVDEPDIEALVDYFPDDAWQFHATDFVSARVELRLPADASPIEYPGGIENASEDEIRFVGAGLLSLPYAQMAAAGRFDPSKSALSRAIDHSQVEGAVRADVPEGRMAAITTTQPFDEIAEALEEEGWTRDGDVLSGGDRREGEWSVSVSDDDDVIVTATRERMDAVLDGDNDGNTAGAMMGGIGGSVRFGLARLDGTGCVETLAGGGDAASGRGTVLVDGGDDPDPDAVAAATADAKGVEFGPPEVRGNVVRVPFSDEGDTPVLTVNRAQSAVTGLVFEPCP